MTTDPIHPLSIDETGSVTVYGAPSGLGCLIDRHDMPAIVVAPASMTDDEARALLTRLVDPEAYPMHPDEMAAEIERLTGERDWWKLATETIATRPDEMEPIEAERDRLRNTLREVLDSYGPPGAVSLHRKSAASIDRFQAWRAVLDATPSPEPTPAADVPVDRHTTHFRRLKALRFTESGATAAAITQDEGQPTYIGAAEFVPRDWAWRDDADQEISDEVPVDVMPGGSFVECRPPVPVPEPQGSGEREPMTADDLDPLLTDSLTDLADSFGARGVRGACDLLWPDLLTEDDDQ